MLDPLTGFVPWLLLLVVFIWLQYRNSARLERRMSEADAALKDSRDFTTAATARAVDRDARTAEAFARQERMMEVAEQAQEDRREMISLLRRIVDLLESRARL